MINFFFFLTVKFCLLALYFLFQVQAACMRVFQDEVALSV